MVYHHLGKFYFPSELMEMKRTGWEGGFTYRDGGDSYYLLSTTIGFCLYDSA